MYKNLASVFEHVRQLDLTHDRHDGYERLVYLVMYRITFNQMELVNARPSHIHPVFLLAPLEVMNQLNSFWLHKFQVGNDKVVRAIQNEHLDMLNRLDHFYKEHSASIANARELLSSHYIWQIHLHVVKTRLMDKWVEILMCFVNILRVYVVNPLQFMVLVWFMERLASDMVELVIHPSEEQNIIAARLHSKMDQLANAFDDNQNIIYECRDERAYIEAMMRHIEDFYAIRKNVSDSYLLTSGYKEFEYRYQRNVLLLTILIPKTTFITWIYSCLQMACTEMTIILVAYQDAQHQLSRLRLDDFEAMPLPDAHRLRPAMCISDIRRGTLLVIRPFSYRIEQRRLFTVARTLRVPSMRWVTLTGASGSGKTTLCRLFLRHVRTADANIAFLGVHSEYTYDDMRPYVSYIKPHSDLFDESIQFNLTYGVQSMDDRRRQQTIETYLKRFDLGHLIGKLDSRIGELSTGEKQRVKLIRCILHDKPIWILDEATSNLDKECELRVLDALRRFQMRRGKSVIHITHNPALRTFGDVRIHIHHRRVHMR
jgi:ABC-type iron transport system FetAB ATPase subunit